MVRDDSYFMNTFNFSPTIVANYGNLGFILCDSWHRRKVNRFPDILDKAYLTVLEYIPQTMSFEWVEKTVISWIL